MKTSSNGVSKGLLWVIRAGIGIVVMTGVSQGSAESLTKEPSPARQQQLIKIVRQDCGSCHGMRLTGGLGPALTRSALAGKPIESLVATVHGGRAGTPMPPWSAMVSYDEAQWIVQRLVSGFPEEAKRGYP